MQCTFEPQRQRVTKPLSSADLHDAAFPYLLHLTFATPYTPHIFTITFLSTLLTLPFLFLVPLRPLFLIGGLAPFAVTHPFIQRTFSLIVLTLPLRSFRARLVRLIDNDTLKDRHWQSELREVELFENERWVPGEGTGWSKNNLKTGERVAWTHGRDGCSAVTADGAGDIRSVVAFIEVWPAHPITAAILLSHWSKTGYSLRRKIGEPTLWPNGAKSVRMTVSITPIFLIRCLMLYDSGMGLYQ